MMAPRIEPEIASKLKETVSDADPTAILAVVEWRVRGFEITNWVFSMLDEQPRRFKLTLTRNGELVEESSGKNSLRSLVLCPGGAEVAELASGDLFGSRTLTIPTLIAAGDEWKPTVDGLDVQSLALHWS